MRRLALLGDSVFDNSAYVPGQSCVAEQVGDALGSKWQVKRFAKDGAKMSGVISQLSSADYLRTRPFFAPPRTAVTYIVLGFSGLGSVKDMSASLRKIDSKAGALAELSELRRTFHREYQYFLRQVAAGNMPIVCCTIVKKTEPLPQRLELSWHSTTRRFCGKPRDTIFLLLI